jgi:hypothetical protein
MSKRNLTAGFIFCVFFLQILNVDAQERFKLKFNNSSVYSGIEVGSKGVKLSIVEIGKNAQSSGAFNILKDSSINTDFISFTDPTFQSTLNALYSLYTSAVKQFKIPEKNVYTTVSSGVKIQAEKDGKTDWINNLIDSFRNRIKDDRRQVAVIDVLEEARLSHLGIVPESRRYNTFLIDIGSGNTKGGYFPNGNTNNFKLFNLTWGTKSVFNTTDKRCDDDKSFDNYRRQLSRVLNEVENSEIIYAVNSSGSYPVTDNMAISGGIAWSVATLMYPELLDNPVVAVTFDKVKKFYETLESNYDALAPAKLTGKLDVDADEKDKIQKEIKRVHQVFDQRSLMAGTGLLLKMMRQFESIYEKKQFFLVKSGQVGWITAYVNQAVSNPQ